MVMPSLGSLPPRARRPRRGILRGINDDVGGLFAQAQTQQSDFQAQREAERLLADMAARKEMQDERQARAATTLESLQPGEAASKGWLERVGNVLDLPTRHVAEPVIGSLLGKAFYAMPGEQKGEKAIREALSGPGDVGPFILPWAPARAEKIRQALLETKLPPGVMGTLKVALDPMVVVPFGKIGTAAKGAALAVKGGGVAAAVKGPAAAGAAKALAPLPKLRELTDMTMTENAFAKLGAKLSEVPGVRGVAVAVNPAAAATSDIGRLDIGYKNLLDIGDNLTNIAVAKVAARKFPWRLDEEGFATLKSGKKVHFHDLLSAPAKYGLTGEELEYARTYGGLHQDVLDMLKARGLNPREVALGGDIEQFISKMVTSKDGIEKIRMSMGASLGSRPWWQKTQYYRTVEEALARSPGLHFESDPMAMLKLYISSGYKTLADADYIKELKPLGQTLGQRIDRFHPGLREQVPELRKQTRALRELGDLITQVYQGRRLAAEPAFMARKVPGLGERFQNAMRIKNEVQRGQVLQQLERDVKGALAQARGDTTKLLGQLQRFRKEAMEAPLGEARIPMAGLSGLTFPIPVAETVMRSFSDRGNRFLQAMSQANGVARIAATGFDMGGAMIQGFPLLTTNLPAWVRAQEMAMEAFLQPRVLPRYLEKHSATLQKMALHRVPVSGSEYVEAAAEKGLLTRVPVVGNLATRAAAGFNTFGDVARVELWEAMEPMVLRKAAMKGIPEEQALQELGDLVSKMTGTMNARKLGVLATQRQMESSLLFAPRYFRASVGLMADAAQGGLKGEMARTSLAKMLAGGLTFYYGMALAFGQEPKLDPRRGDFLTVKIGDQNVGFGSIWVAGARFLGDIYQQAEENPGGFLSINPQKTVLARFARYRAAPIAGFGWDAATGRDAIGRPLDTPLQFGAAAVANVVPFWAQDFIPDFAQDEYQEPGGSLVAMPAEFAGMRTFPVSIFEQRKQRREQLAQALPVPRKWDELSGMEKAILEKQDPMLGWLNQQTRAWGMERGDDLDQARSEFLLKRQAIRDDYIMSVQKAQDAVAARQGTGKDFRERVKEVAALKRHDYQELYSEARFQPVIASFQELQAQTPIEKRHLDDAVFDVYVNEVILAPGLEDALGNVDYKLRDDLVQTHIVDHFGQEAYQRLLQRLASSMELPVMLREWHDGLEIARPYWEIGPEMARKAGVLEQYERRNQVPGSAEADQLEEMTPQLAIIDRAVTKARQAMRRSSPALDAWLFKYGYTTTLTNRLTEGLGKEVLERWNSDTLALPMALR